MLDRIKVMSLLDQIGEAIARFQGFTYTLSCLSQIILFMSISEFGNKSRGKSNLHKFDLCVLCL